jgi:hypothetical protein
LHEPDNSVEKDSNGVPVVVPLPGFYTIGAVVDGVFVPIFRRKAAGLFADIARAKADAQAAAPPAADTPTV